MKHLIFSAIALLTILFAAEVKAQEDIRHWIRHSIKPGVTGTHSNANQSCMSASLDITALDGVFVVAEHFHHQLVPNVGHFPMIHISVLQRRREAKTQEHRNNDIKWSSWFLFVEQARFDS